MPIANVVTFIKQGSGMACPEPYCNVGARPKLAWPYPIHLNLPIRWCAKFRESSSTCSADNDASVLEIKLDLPSATNDACIF